MPFRQIENQFATDVEFRKLLSREAEIDLVDAALELARDADPHVDFASTKRWIADRIAELSGPVALCRTENDALQEVSECLAARHGLGGDLESYQQADSSYLNRVIETKRGIPISLSILYIAVGQKLGLDLYGVSSPSHFLIGCRTMTGSLFVDAFTNGRLMDRFGTIGWLSELTGWSRIQVAGSLRPATPRQIIIRMLNNLKRLYAFQENWQAAWPVQQRLLALHPGVYDHQRDLAVIAYKAERFGRAFDMLDACKRRCPEDEAEGLKTMQDRAQSRLAGWN